MATLQPVTLEPSEFWTNDFRTAVQWFRAVDSGKRMKLALKAPATDKQTAAHVRKKSARKTGATK